MAGVVLLDEYRRRRGDLERRRQTMQEEQQRLEVQADRRKELTGLSRSIEDFCTRVQQGLEQATFDQKRLLIELLIDRIIVTDEEVEIRYVVPTTRVSEQIRFCDLRLDYRTRSPHVKIDFGWQRLWFFSERVAADTGNRNDAHDAEGQIEMSG